MKAICPRVPASVAMLCSMVLTYVMTRAYDDYRLFLTLGAGGAGDPTLRLWLYQTLFLRRFAMSKRASRDPDALPLDDEEWEARVRASGQEDILQALPLRQGRRPLTAGLVPHRQVEAIAPHGSRMQKEVIAHIVSLAERYPDELTIALSAFEGVNAPSLYAQHRPALPALPDAGPTAFARLMLSCGPCPKTAMMPDDRSSGNDEKEALKTNVPRDPTKHEFAHVHLTEGSMHITLSPQDCRRVLSRGWGELHLLAGLRFRGHYMPPYWLPRWFFRLAGGESHVRWAYLLRGLTTSSVHRCNGQAPPPTFTCVYAPTNDEQLHWVKRIIDSSVAWSIGRPL